MLTELDNFGKIKTMVEVPIIYQEFTQHKIANNKTAVNLSCDLLRLRFFICTNISKVC